MQTDDPYYKYLLDLIKTMLDKGASDLFVTVGAPPSIKVDGELTQFNTKPLSAEQAEAIIRAAMTERQIQEFQATKECNFALSLSGIGRFRVNTFVQRGSPGLVARHIVTEVPTLDGLGLPEQMKKIVMEKRGLVLMVGATGSGKSTSLAAMLGHRNEHSRGHIITIEDPIEFVHPHRKCLVSQREVGMDTDNWFAALKNTLRQAPDVILIGEIRERETMEYAIAFSETGHLCLATLHANNANQALDRIINFFPDDRRQQLLMDLSLNLRGIISQRLIPKIDGGRIPAIEILLNSPFISDLVLRGLVHDIKPVMAKSRDQGMSTFDQSLYDLCAAGLVDPLVAVRYADSQNDFRISVRNLPSVKAPSAQPPKFGSDGDLTIV